MKYRKAKWDLDQLATNVHLNWKNCANTEKNSSSAQEISSYSVSLYINRAKAY